MATTTPSLKSPATWLVLGLTCQRRNEQVELLITFTNTQVEAQTLSFSNQTRKAELLGLQVMQQNGERVLPVHHLLIRPTHTDTSSRLLQQGEAFSYSLFGKLTAHGLEFPGAFFAIMAGQTYHLHFKYAGRKSNVVTLTV